MQRCEFTIQLPVGMVLVIVQYIGATHASVLIDLLSNMDYPSVYGHCTSTPPSHIGLVHIALRTGCVIRWRWEILQHSPCLLFSNSGAVSERAKHSSRPLASCASVLCVGHETTCACRCNLQTHTLNKITQINVLWSMKSNRFFVWIYSYLFASSSD